MNSKEFAELAIQLLEAAQIPGNALSIALAFKETAEALRRGDVVLTKKD